MLNKVVVLNVTDRSTQTSLGFLRKYCEIWSSEPEKLTYFVLLLNRNIDLTYVTYIMHVFSLGISDDRKKRACNIQIWYFFSLWSKHGASLPWTVTRLMDMKTESTRTWSVSTIGSLGFLIKMIVYTTSLVPYRFTTWPD